MYLNATGGCISHLDFLLHLLLLLLSSPSSFFLTLFSLTLCLSGFKWNEWGALLHFPVFTLSMQLRVQTGKPYSLLFLCFLLGWQMSKKILNLTLRLSSVVWPSLGLKNMINTITLFNQTIKTTMDPKYFFTCRL